MNIAGILYIVHNSRVVDQGWGTLGVSAEYMWGTYPQISGAKTLKIFSTSKPRVHFQVQISCEVFTYRYGKIVFIDLKNRRGPPFAFVEFEDTRWAGWNLPQNKNSPSSGMLRMRSMPGMGTITMVTGCG